MKKGSQEKSLGLKRGTLFKNGQEFVY
jgi:hypothetical protein